MGRGSRGEDSNLTQVHCISGSQITIDNLLSWSKSYLSWQVRQLLLLYLPFVIFNSHGLLWYLEKNVCDLLDGCLTSCYQPWFMGSSNACSCQQNSDQVLLKWGVLGAIAQWVQCTLCTAPLPLQLAAGGANNPDHPQIRLRYHLVQASAQSRANFQVL